MAISLMGVSCTEPLHATSPLATSLGPAIQPLPESQQLNPIAAILEHLLARMARFEARLDEYDRRLSTTHHPLRPEPDPPDGPPLYATAQPQFQFTYYQQPPLTSAASAAGPLHQTHLWAPLLTSGENMSDLEESYLSSSTDSASSGKNMSNTFGAEDESTLNSSMCIQNGTNIDHFEDIITDVRNTKTLFMEGESVVNLMEQGEVRDHAAEQAKTEAAKVKMDLHNEIKEDNTLKQVYGTRGLARNLEESLDALVEITRVTEVEGSESKIDEMETRSLVDGHKANKERAVSHTMERLKKKGQTCTFDPGGNTLLKLLFASLYVVSWFPP